MTIYYSGIGSRQTPQDILQSMVVIGRYLGAAGFTLRSGAAERADSAFEQGCDEAHARKEIYLPWDGYNHRKANHRNIFVGVSEESLDLAAEYHPAWDRCSGGAMRLHARNCHIALGDDLKTPSAFVVCWTPRGAITGGTGQALRIASAFDIPVFNLAHSNALHRLDEYVKEIDEYTRRKAEQAKLTT